MTARPKRTIASPPAPQAAAPQGSSEPAPPMWSPRVRAVVSVLLAAHLVAIFAAPWSMPPPTSELSRTVARPFAPYLHAAFLYHGYRFFAPNPSSSHIVDYELVYDDGNTKEGRFPDLRRHWPRLLYHRHFMISERVWELGRAASAPPQPPQFPPGVPAVEKNRALAEHERAKVRFEEARVRRDLLLNGIAKQLLAESGAKSVRLWAVEHAIPRPDAVLEGIPLTHQDSYLRIPLGEFPPTSTNPSFESVPAEPLGGELIPAEPIPSERARPAGPWRLP